ncbi:putative ripening-related protein 6 [Lolium perenne]|uniref:putative ripening-related protein 6 n=1 Tax=Lolium perenne TaxID=4522 RepID=UPI0021F645F6|nr:putative ripening-related protein 6 [Lolium perenne]
MAHAKLAALAVLVVILLHGSPRALAIDQMPATMTLNGFERGEGEPAECDGQYHNNKEMLAALSTRWYAGGIRCQKMISITNTQNGRTVQARVVDECDSNHGCKDNIVDTSVAVWNALGLDTNIGEVHVTWSDS